MSGVAGPFYMSDTPEKGVRLNRFLASCGVASRRGSETFISQGRVEINGEIVTDLSARVQPNDHVKFDNKLLRTASELTLLLHKPKGYLCTRDDPEGRPTIYQLLPAKFRQIHYVGRLDYQSEGLLILTNSGELTETLTHPRNHIEKEYEVQLDRPFDPEMTKHLLSGIHLDEGLAKAELVAIESRRRLRVVLMQGYNRQIRRMFAKLDYKVRKLERIRIGKLMANDLSTGEYRFLSPGEINSASTNP